MKEYKTWQEEFYAELAPTNATWAEVIRVFIEKVESEAYQRGTTKKPCNCLPHTYSQKVINGIYNHNIERQKNTIYSLITSNGNK